MLNLTYHSTNNGFCRVYYRSPGKHLYAFQEDRRDEFTLYACSRDGEPSHEVTVQVAIDHPPEAECSTSRSFIAWAQKAGIVRSTN
ncbi:hypothetical protein D9M70_325130 [compost metagenome]